MEHKIVFLDSSTLGEINNINLLHEFGDYVSYASTTPSQTIDRLKNCSIVITNKVVIGRDVIDACPDLKLICVAATGMNNIDLSYADKKGIVVKNVVGYSTESVAQSTLAMLFSLLHKMSYYDDFVKSGQYAESKIFTHHPYSFYELKGKQFGIIGLGAIGSRVASIAEAFGAIIRYYSTSGRNDSTDYKRSSLSEILSTSDIISVHCPLNDQTYDLIGEEQFKLFKPNAILINVARGGIINEHALAKAIDSRQIGGAATDVMTTEPIQTVNPLLNVKLAENLLITPHIAWTSIESRKLLVEKIAENIKSFVTLKK